MAICLKAIDISIKHKTKKRIILEINSRFSNFTNYKKALKTYQGQTNDLKTLNKCLKDDKFKMKFHHQP